VCSMACSLVCAEVPEVYVRCLTTCFMLCTSILGPTFPGTPS